MQKTDNQAETPLFTRYFKVKTRQAMRGGYPYGIAAKVLDSDGNKVASVSGAGFDMLGYLVSETLTYVFKEEITKNLENLLKTDYNLAESTQKILFPKQGTKLGYSLDQVITSAKNLGFYVSLEDNKSFKISFKP